MATNNIMELTEYKTFIMYRAACGCSSKDCDLTMILEHDRELVNDITLTMYQNLYYTDYWGSDYFWGRWWLRLKGVVKLLFTGRIRIEGSFIFEDTKQLDAFLEALQEGKERIQKELAKREADKVEK